MKDFKLPEQMFKNALTKCKEFKTFITTIERRLEAFDCYVSAVHIGYSVSFDVTFEYHHMDWPDENESYTCKFYVNPNDTIVGHTENLKKVLCDLITQHFKDTFNRGDLAYYHKVDSIQINMDEYSLIDSKLIAWSSRDKVGIYWIEQECGEHWIILPITPKKEVATYLNIR